MDRKDVAKGADRLVRRREDHEQPAAVIERGWRYHHLGIPYSRPMAGERHIPHLKIFVHGFPTSPYGIEWIRFEEECEIPDLVRTVPHIAFEVDNMEEALNGKEVLLEPGSPSRGCRTAMIVHDGAPIELLEFDYSVKRLLTSRKR